MRIVPTGDVIAGSDGRLAIEIGLWAKDKLLYIRKYCEIFNMGMKNQWATRTYIDLFSGPGACVVESTGEEMLGSPFVALSCKPPFTHYFFNDLNQEFINTLESRASSYHPSINV